MTMGAAIMLVPMMNAELDAGRVRREVGAARWGGVSSPCSLVMQSFPKKTRGARPESHRLLLRGYPRPGLEAEIF